MDKKQAGKTGEQFAADYYRKLGFEIIEMNYHSRYGEIDVIAENESTIVFCEVKARREGSFTSPAEAVDFKKQKKITLTAFAYLDKNLCDKTPRFDVFEIWMKGGRIFKFNNIVSAFEASDFSGQYDVF